MEASDGSNFIASQVQMVAKELCVPFDPEVRGGSSDACNTSEEGCPSVDGLGAIGEHSHRSDEYVLLSPTPKKVALLSGVIVALTSKTK